VLTLAGALYGVGLDVRAGLLRKSPPGTKPNLLPNEPIPPRPNIAAWLDWIAECRSPGPRHPEPEGSDSRPPESNRTRQQLGPTIEKRTGEILIVFGRAIGAVERLELTLVRFHCSDFLTNFVEATVKGRRPELAMSLFF
jgi:hypothetical protein